MVDTIFQKALSDGAGKALFSIPTLGSDQAYKFPAAGGTLALSGSGGGDMLSTLTNVESAITGAASASAFGTMYLCSGTSADYTVSLPTSLTGLKNKIMGFRMDPGLTKLVTVDAGAGHLIDGVRTRVTWANEVALLKVNTDETNWTKVGGKTIPMVASLGVNGNQTFAATTTTLLNFTTPISQLCPAAMIDATNKKLIFLRNNPYRLELFTRQSTGSTSCNTYLIVNLNALGQWYHRGSYYVTGNVIHSILSDVVNGVAGNYITPYAYYTGGSFPTTFMDNDTGGGQYNKFALTEIPTW